MWLLKNRKHIDDYNEIRCENFDDKVGVQKTANDMG